MRWLFLDLTSDPDEAEYLGDPGQLIDAADLVLELSRRPSWHAQAACRGQGIESFFPGQGGDLRPVLAVCAGCDVRAECLAAADYMTAGIWGGLSERGRKMARRSVA